MKIACHQPCYLPWVGFFYKALRVDTLVLLDSVQLPRGTSWVTRNRVKTPTGQSWLTVPVKRKGRGLQRIMDVEIFNERSWRRRHFETLIHAYKKSPFLEDHGDSLSDMYARTWTKLVDLNLWLIGYVLKSLDTSVDIRLSSELGVKLKGTPLIVEICNRMKADAYATISTSRTHLDEGMFLRSGIRLDYYNFRCPPYPQLWGDFIPNLSAIDMLLNCGPKSRRIIEKGGRRSSST